MGRMMNSVRDEIEHLLRYALALSSTREIYLYHHDIKGDLHEDIYNLTGYTTSKIAEMVLDLVGVPEDNTLDASQDSTERYCRDYYYIHIFDFLDGRNDLTLDEIIKLIEEGAE